MILLNNSNLEKSVILVKKLVATLPQEEKLIAEARWGLSGSLPLSPSEVMKRFNISQARFDEIEAKVTELLIHKDDSLNMGKMYPERKFRVGDLSDRERSIIQERLGVVGGVAKTREEVCKFFAISDERLRQVEEKAKKILSEAVKAPVFPPRE